MDKRIAEHRAILEAPNVCICDKEIPNDQSFCSVECRTVYESLPYFCIVCNTELTKGGPSCSFCETCLYK